MATAVQHAATTADGHTRPPPTTEADGADEEALSLLGAVPRAAPSLTRTDSVLLHSQRTFALLMGIVIVVVEAVPFGLAIFPSELRLSGVCGIQIFLLSSAVGQAVLTLGSQFDMATGLMMCENVPLMHELSAGIHAYLAPRGRGASTMSTIIAACALSTLAVGVGFYALGALRLGALVGRLPAHSLLGCIGGVAFFTTQLGFEVSTALPFAWWQPAHMRALLRPDELPLWTLSYGLALGLRALSARIKSPVLTPAYFLAIPFVAHGALFALGMRSSDARVARYFFASPNAVEAAADASAGAEQRPLVRDHFELYGAFDPRLVAWDAMAMQLPVLLAIVGFSLAHVPINVPALTLTSGVRADVDTELRVHGAACVLAGCVGWPPAYMCYANTATYLKCGGGGRVYGGLLAVAMVVFAHVGPQCISVVPRCVRRRRARPLAWRARSARAPSLFAHAVRVQLHGRGALLPHRH